MPQCAVQHFHTHARQELLALLFALYMLFMPFSVWYQSVLIIQGQTKVSLFNIALPHSPRLRVRCSFSSQFSPSKEHEAESLTLALESD